MKLKLRPTSMLLNFALAVCFVPSMFGSHDDDPCAFFGFDDSDGSLAKKPAQTYSHSNGLTLGDKGTTHCDSFDDGIFDFELSTPPTQLVVSGPAASRSSNDTDDDDDSDRHSTDSGAEESDEDAPDLDTDLLPIFLAVTKSTAIAIRPRSQSDLVHVTKGKQRERSGSDPIAIPRVKPKLSTKAENFSLGLHSLYEEYDYKAKKTLIEYPLFDALLKMSKDLTTKEIKLVLDSLPKDSHSSFALKTEVYAFLMGKQTSIMQVKARPIHPHDLLPKPNKLLIMP